MSDYEPSPTAWVREQVEAIERAGTTRAVDIFDRQVVLLTLKGRKSGATRKVPLMRVEHDGSYAAVASVGGGPKHPQWYFNLVADPTVTLQDGTETFAGRARLLQGVERETWWARCVAAFPNYAGYAVRAAVADRTIPVFLIEPSPRSS